MSNTRSRCSLDDLPLEILSRIFVVLGSESTKDIASARLCSKKMYEAGVILKCIEQHALTCLQLLDDYFGWAVPDDGEYTGVVDSAKELL
uniref:F-box domain-containing protein n=1 Tax=Lactuca sativa TaxID=4236 RepID=A0A9R1UL19_LACSA|nr:hypothetical protein LSAT_V11C900496080 [Lactuca sativa]